MLTKEDFTIQYVDSKIVIPIINDAIEQDYTLQTAINELTKHLKKFPQHKDAEIYFGDYHDETEEYLGRGIFLIVDKPNIEKEIDRKYKDYLRYLKLKEEFGG